MANTLRTYALCMACFLAFGAAGVLSAELPRMEEIIDNVAANEELYRSIEVIHHTDYALSKDTKLFMPQTLTARRETIRCVLQGELIYINTKSDEKTHTGAARLGSLLGFDGDKTRVVSTTAIEGRTEPGTNANIHHDRFQPCTVYRPHVWSLGRSQLCAPFSVWLRGGADLRRHPLGGIYTANNIDVRCAVVGVETVDGLRCIKLRSEYWHEEQPGKPGSFRFLWLAPERNYLPIRTDGYDLVWSGSLPVELARATDLQEIKPGVWLPFRVSSTSYESEALAENKQVLWHWEEHTIEKVTLKPQYDISLFRDIPIPEDALVYELRDGKVIKGPYGGPLRTEPATNNRERVKLIAWLITLALALVAVIAIWLLRRRRAAKPAQV